MFPKKEHIETGPVTPEEGFQPAYPIIPEEVNAVIIHRSYDENGSIRASVQALGDVRLAEVPTILKIGLREVNEAMNLT